jgi:Mn2+/Fe2+ NRAMP family transporter
MKKTFIKTKKFFKVFGPGVVTGAADDDPSGIATYTQTGAKFGYGQLWTVIAMLPLMVAVQEACARIGAVTGHGLSTVIKTNYSKKVLYAAVLLVVVANTINIGADIGALAAAAQLLVPVNYHFNFRFYCSDFNFRNIHFLPDLFTYLNLVGLNITSLSAHALYY